MSDSGRRLHPVRLALLIGLIALWSLSILARLVQLQIARHEEFINLALQQQQLTRSILAPRGVIYDSNMDELATSIAASTVVAEPRRIANKQASAKTVASILGLDYRGLLAKMTDPARQSFMIVQRRISPKAEEQVAALKMDGLYLVEESMRVYPNRELACHALGFVNMNGDGGAGIELEYDTELKGTQGQISFDVDARRRSFRGHVEKPPIQGHSLVLSINRSIQYIVERELKAGVENSRANAGVAIVMESDTGRILAMAGYPNFNTNAYNKYEASLWRNRSVSDVFEPGSTFKVVVAATALEAGLTRPDELIDCQMGSIVIGKHLFHDHKPYGLLTFSQVLENSSNVGAVKLGLRLGEKRLYEGLRRFGFGAKSGIDLPGEIDGLVRDWHQWSGLSIGAISFGQEVGVTSIQILNAVNAIANGGYLARPSIVDRVIDANGDLIRENNPERTKILSPSTAAEIRDAFEGVVLRGTGKKAALEGYRVAGKTGTAQKIIDGRYSKDKFVASFIGFAPLPQPRVTVLVQLDEPKGAIYGGDVSAPIFQKIAQESLLQLHVPPDTTGPAPALNLAKTSAGSEDYLPDATPVLPLAGLEDSQFSAGDPEEIAVQVSDEMAFLPDFQGMAKRSVLESCMALGIRLQANGSGLAISQIPPAGTPIPAGAVCTVTFAKIGLKGMQQLVTQEDSGEQKAAALFRAAGSRP
ncbi:MAG: penicillin-binding protein [Acidobacteria bacterium]|nr:penicillin-binding protein [Acidobacteriota bacterium]